MTFIHESKALRFAVGATWPGANARVYSGGVDDPWPTYEIMFKNGVRFEGDHKLTVINDAKAYYETVKALTGEPP